MSEFSDFIRSASNAEKESVYSDVIDRATERQNRSKPMGEIKPSSWTYRCGDMPWMMTVHEPEWEPDLEVRPLYDESALTQARAEAIEECAKVCEGVAEHAVDSRSCYAADNCADAIRALDERTE